MKRRTSLQVIAAAGLAGCSRRDDDARPHLSDAELQRLELICEQIIPSGDSPGSLEAGASNYINVQLTGRLSQSAEHYHNGLAALDSSSREVFGRGFATLEYAERTELLKLLESGEVNQEHWSHQPSPAFFAMVRQHTVEGTFCPPQYGGNRNLVGYQLIGWEYPEALGQNRYSEPRFSQEREEP